MTKIAVDDIVRVDDEPRAWRVTARDREAGTLELESLTAYPRQTWRGVDERRVAPSSVYG